MGDVSGAHFQIITQKGRRKVKLIQRQRKKNTKICNKIHAKASSRMRLAGWSPYLRFCHSTICISWDYAMIDTWYFLRRIKKSLIQIGLLLCCELAFQHRCCYFSLDNWQVDIWFFQRNTMYRYHPLPDDDFQLSSSKLPSKTQKHHVF